MIVIGKHRYCSLVELEADAVPLIEASALGYLRSGAESEATLRRNTDQWSSEADAGAPRFVPRCLVDVSGATTACTLLSKSSLSSLSSSMPVMVAPMAMQRLANAAEGERGMARGARNAGVPMVLSTMSTTSMEDVVDEAGSGHLLFQLYCLKDREVTRRLVERATRLGFRGIVVTVDAPVLGKREADEKSGFSLPHQFELAIVEREEREGRGDHHHDDDDLLEGTGPAGLAGSAGKFRSEFGSLIDTTLDWSVVGFLRSITKLPIVLKGVLSPLDAGLAVKHGVDAIVVSNHGGRQLDHCVGALDVLEEVVKVVRGRCEVWLDGGVRRGTDVVKAIALGADAVLVGRPMLWALALGGGDGVEAALNELQKDVLRTMMLLGVRSWSELKRTTKRTKKRTPFLSLGV